MDVSSAASPGAEEQPSDYELLRMRNIERNKSVMQDLGLDEKVVEKPAKRSPKKRKEATCAEPSRRSKRVQGGPVDYTKETIDRFGDEIDLKIDIATKADDRAQREREEVLEDLAQIAEEARASMAQIRASLEPAALDGEGEAAWRAIAEERWGPRVALASPHSWEMFVMSRMPIEVPKSPNGLLQERYANCPWRLLISCNLMSRVSSAETKHRCIEGFFASFPTPRQVRATMR